VRQEAADQTVERIISTQLLDADYLRAILGRFQSRQPERNQNADKLAHQREKLEAERQRLLRMALKGTCTEEDFVRESKRIEAEIHDLGLLASAPVPAALDTAKLVVHITRSLARFATQPFEERRSLVRTVFKEIVLEDGAIPSVTINGSFLDCVNSVPRSRPFH
jgi:hypothetical protein